MTELELHISVAEYLDLVLPSEAWWSTIGHGGGGFERGSKLKAMGVKPGFPDIIILFDSFPWLIELKNEKGILSQAQKECHAAINDAGVRVTTCRSIDDVRNTLIGWNIPIREKVAG